MFNNNISEVFSLSGSSDSVLVMVSSQSYTGENGNEEEGLDDIKEYVATISADNINTAQPELMRNILLLTMDQMLEVQLCQEVFKVSRFWGRL